MINERLNLLRTKMCENGLDFYFINTSDYHMSEYIPEYFKTLRYFSGFSGSLGQLVVTFDEAYLFVDGRYHGQADLEAGVNGIKVMKLGKEGVPTAAEFLIQNVKEGTLGLDGKCVSAAFVKQLEAKNIKIKSLDIYSDIYEDRAELSKDKLFPFDVKYAGYSRATKLDIVKRCLKNRTHIINNLESIAYLLNLRGNDIAYTPVFLSYMVFHKSEVYLFVDLERIEENDFASLYNDGVIIRPYLDYYEFIKTIKRSVVLIDDNKVNYETYVNLDASNKIFCMRSIVEEMKSVKNKVEVENSKLAHIYDGVAMVRFLKWLKESDKEGLSEYDVKCKVNECRLGYKAFDLSFNTIVGYNENAAMMHYSPTADNYSMLHNSGMILIDSGGQYFEGTTDITRTVALGEVDDEVKMWFTLVLKSMFNLQRVKFIEGLSGDKLDILARKDLWMRGVDYRCGTGHGVGHVLAVHEAPPNVRYQRGSNNGQDVPFKPGNIFSDEPGVYFEGKFGIRCENLMVCNKDIKNEYGQFLSFEFITMVPFDLDMIDKKYLDDETIDALNAYHARVYETLAPYLNDEEKEFLKNATRSI